MKAHAEKPAAKQQDKKPIRYEVVGHSKQRVRLEKLLLEDRLPGALVFTGNPSIGKRGVALELATKLLCKGGKLHISPPTQSDLAVPCGNCTSCTLSNAGNHPDLHEICFGGEDGASVDQLRETLDQLNLTSFLGGRKVALINNADSLSIVGANILLKSLEEPRPDTYFLLVAHNPSRLPQTLLSRCQRWYFDKLTSEDMKCILTRREDIAPQDLALLLAEGSFSSLEMMKARPGMWEDIEQTLEAAFAGQDSRVLASAQAWASEKDAIRDRCVLLLAAVQRRLHEHAAEPSAAAIWALAIQNVIDAEYLMVERHVSPLLTFTTLLRRCAKANGDVVMNYPDRQLPLLESIGR